MTNHADDSEQITDEIYIESDKVIPRDFVGGFKVMRLGDLLCFFNDDFSYRLTEFQARRLRDFLNQNVR